MKIAAIMPCRGRPEQTVRNVRRLLTTAGDVAWQLICMVDRDPIVAKALAAVNPPVWVIECAQPGYWNALQQATEQWPEFTHLIGLANDLLPGMHWLRRAADAYEELFGDGPGMIGFNGDSHETEHSCHFLISRALLDRYGGWPVWYAHTFGDTELCQRAIAEGLYAKAPYAMLYHDHPYFGGQDDAVYAEGRANSERDQRLYEQRRRQGWPTVGSR